MEGHPYLIKGIPAALWKEFRMACIHFNTTAKDHLLTCMSDLVVRYHRSTQEIKTGRTYKLDKRKKK